MPKYHLIGEGHEIEVNFSPIGSIQEIVMNNSVPVLRVAWIGTDLKTENLRTRVSSQRPFSSVHLIHDPLLSHVEGPGSKQENSLISLYLVDPWFGHVAIEELTKWLDPSYRAGKHGRTNWGDSYIGGSGRPCTYSLEPLTRFDAALQRYYIRYRKRQLWASDEVIEREIERTKRLIERWLESKEPYTIFNNTYYIQRMAGLLRIAAERIPEIYNQLYRHQTTRRPTQKILTLNQIENPILQHLYGINDKLNLTLETVHGRLDGELFYISMNFWEWIRSWVE